MEGSQLMRKLEEIRKIDVNKKFTPEEMEERRRKRRGPFSYPEVSRHVYGGEPAPRPSLPQKSSAVSGGFNMETMRQSFIVPILKSRAPTVIANRQGAVKNPVEPQPSQEAIEVNKESSNGNTQKATEKESMGFIKLQPVQQFNSQNGSNPPTNQPKVAVSSLFKNIPPKEPQFEVSWPPRIQVSSERVQVPSTLFLNKPNDKVEQKKKEVNLLNVQKMPAMPNIFNNSKKPDDTSVNVPVLDNIFSKPALNKVTPSTAYTQNLFAKKEEKPIEESVIKPKASLFGQPNLASSSESSQQAGKSNIFQHNKTDSNAPVLKSSQPREITLFGIKVTSSQDMKMAEEPANEDKNVQKQSSKEVQSKKQTDSKAGTLFQTKNSVVENKASIFTGASNIFLKEPSQQTVQPGLFKVPQESNSKPSPVAQVKPEQKKQIKPEPRVNLFGTSTLSSKPADSSSQSTGKLFTQNIIPTTPNLFSKPLAAPPTDQPQQTGSIFNNKSSSSSGGLFSSKTVEQSVEKLPEKQPAKPVQKLVQTAEEKVVKSEQSAGLFKLKPVEPESGTGIFGSKPAENQAAKPGGFFGSNKLGDSQVDPPVGGLFGSTKPTDSQASKPVGGLFGSTNPTQTQSSKPVGGLFGSSKPVENQTAKRGGLFDSTKPTDDQANKSGGIFGSKPKDNEAEKKSSSGIFGSTSTPNPSFFGSKQPEKESTTKQEQKKAEPPGLFGLKPQEPAQLSQSFFNKAATGGLFSSQKDSVFNSNNPASGSSLFSSQNTPSSSLFGKAHANNKQSQDEQGDDDEPLQASQQNFDPSKSTGNYDGYSNTKILFKGQCSKYREGSKQTLQNLTISLQKFEGSDTIYLIVRLANKRPVITATILPLTTVRSMNNSDRNIHLTKIMIQRSEKKELIEIKMRFDDQSVGKNLREQVEKVLKKKE